MALHAPRKYWRIACPPGDVLQADPRFAIPEQLALQVKPPRPGHGLLLATYDHVEETGLVHRLGILRGGTASEPQVDWQDCEAKIWVDTTTGQRFWKAGHFGFYEKKNADYGLDTLFCDHFPDLSANGVSHTTGARRTREPPIGRIPRGRTEPMEVVGQPTEGLRAGVVYVLQSAYGFKVGRTRSIPDRMRTFAVRLPFFYTIPLCVWFDDCEAAERHYHTSFHDKRINGEWFDLSHADIDKIRTQG